MGLTSSRTSFRPSASRTSNEVLWMPTRSGSGSASSSLAKLTRSRTGRRGSRKNSPPVAPQGHPAERRFCPLGLAAHDRTGHSNLRDLGGSQGDASPVEKALDG